MNSHIVLAFSKGKHMLIEFGCKKRGETQVESCSCCISSQSGWKIWSSWLRRAALVGALLFNYNTQIYALRVELMLGHLPLMDREDTGSVDGSLILHNDPHCS